MAATAAGLSTGARLQAATLATKQMAKMALTAFDIDYSCSQLDPPVDPA